MADQWVRKSISLTILTTERVSSQTASYNGNPYRSTHLPLALLCTVEGNLLTVIATFISAKITPNDTILGPELKSEGENTGLS